MDCFLVNQHILRALKSRKSLYGVNILICMFWPFVIFSLLLYIVNVQCTISPSYYENVYFFQIQQIKRFCLTLTFLVTINQHGICTEEELCSRFCMNCFMPFLAIKIILSSKNGVYVLGCIIFFFCHITSVAYFKVITIVLEVFFFYLKN